MYLIGGSMNGREYQCAQMYRLDLSTMSWDMVGTRCAQEGQLPVTLDEHSAILEGNRIIIFGGFDNGERVNNIYTFDVDTMTWARIEPANAAAA